MNNIKTFENYEEGLTMKVDSDKFYHREEKSEEEEFTASEIKKIEMSSKNYKIIPERHGKDYLILKVSDKMSFNPWGRKDLYDTHLSINKRSDEWFLVMKYPVPKDGNKYVKLPQHLTEYYIIDGFSDLIDVLSGKRNIIKSF